MANDNFTIAFVIFRSMEGQERVLNAYQRTVQNPLTKKLKECLRKKKNKNVLTEIEKDTRPEFMDSHKLNVMAACDTNMVLWNSFKKSGGRTICKYFTHYLDLFTLLGLGVGSVWYLSSMKTEMAKEYPEFG